jgi:HEAT repeat protein
MTLSPFVLLLALTASHFPSSTAHAALGAARPLVHLELKRIKEPFPPPSTIATSKDEGIEVSVGQLPSGVGGPADDAILRAAKLGVTAEAALEFFRLRTPPGPGGDKVQELVRQLGAPGQAERDEAQRKLVAIGPPAMSLVRTAANNIDEAEASTRARQILAAVEGNKASELVIHNARVLAARKPAGAAEAILAYLPYAEDNSSFQELEGALVAVAMTGGKPDPALLKGLKDDNGIRRGTAAQVLSQVGGPAHYPTIRPLLKDPLPSVRLRVALGLVGAHDGEAVPVLIDLIGELPPSLKPVAEGYLNDLAGEWAVSGPKGHDLMSKKLRRDVWQAWWKNTDGETLLEELRSRTPSEEDREKIDGLIKKLEDKDASARDAAVLALASLGKKATSQLRRAINASSPVGGPLAQKALEAIEKSEPNPLPAPAARLLALRRPEGAVEALLGYVAVAESEEVQHQIIGLLASIGVPGGKADEALVKGLRDRSPLRRAAAVTALCRAKAAAHYPLLRKMLDDKDPLVRFRLGEGLASVGDKIGIPAVIASLKDLPLETAWDAEELLTRLAGDKAPAAPLGADAESRAKSVAAWSKWWKENEASVDLAKVEMGERESGNLIVIEQWNAAKGGGRIYEADRSLKPRWEVGRLNYPNYAVVLRNGNVLAVEQQSTITERDRKGTVLTNIGWGQTIYLDKMPDGNIFVGCHNGVFIFDKAGKQIYNHYYNVNSLVAVKRFKDGSFAYVSYSGHYVRLDKNGKQLKTFNLPWGMFGINGAEILPNDRVVVSVSNFNKVICYGPDTKQVWEVPMNSPMYPTATPGGNILVVGEGQTKILEIDRRGKVVKEMKGFEARPFRVTRRQ